MQDTATRQYFHRACWALQNAGNNELPAVVRSHMTAMAAHACQSLKESLQQIIEAEPESHAELKAALRDLPHAALIENIRNLDLHGWPLPVCDPGIQMMAMVAKPGRPITLKSSGGVGVVMQMDGLRPRVHRTPKDLKRGKVTFGPAASFGCADGRMIVHDFAMGKDFFMLDVLRDFLLRCRDLLNEHRPMTPPSQADSCS